MTTPSKVVMFGDANGTAFIGLKSSNKDEESGDCDGREYDYEQRCIK